MGSGENTAGRPVSDAAGSISTSLLDRVKAQDQGAWQRLVKLYGPVVYRWCRRAGLQGSDAADVAQEVFQSMMIGIGGFRRRRPGDSFRGWLWTITKNKLRDHLRRRALRPRAAGGTNAHQLIQQVTVP